MLRAKAAEKKMKEQAQILVSQFFRQWKDLTKKHVLLWKKVKNYLFGQENGVKDFFRAWKQYTYDQKVERLRRNSDVCLFFVLFLTAE